MSRSAGESQTLAEKQVSARTVRLYLGHLRHFADWQREEYGAGLVDATSQRSVNAALAALQHFHARIRDAGQVRTNATAKLKSIASQPLAPEGFSQVKRQQLRHEAERAGPIADSIVSTLLNTGRRVDELVDLTLADVTLQFSSRQSSDE